MADTDLPLYPKGSIGFGAGNLKQATLGRFSYTNNGTLTHSLAQTPSGIFFGNRECSGSIEFEVSELGIERDVVEDVAKGKRRQFRFKDATKTYEIVGALVKTDWETTTSAPVKISCDWVGKLVSPK